MIIIILTAVLSIGSVSLHYFTGLFMHNSYREAQNSLTITGRLFYSTYVDLLSNVVKFASSDTFQNFVEDTALHGTGNYTDNYNKIQPILASLKDSSSLIRSVVIAGKNQELYSLYNDRVKDMYLKDFFTFNPAEIHGITWIPIQKEAVHWTDSVVPVVIPLTKIPNNYLMTTKDLNDANVIIIILLDTERLNVFLTQQLAPDSGSSIYLADNSGQPVNLETKSHFFINASEQRQIDHVRSVQNENSIPMFSNQEYLSYIKYLDLGGLYLVELISKQNLYREQNSIRLFIIVITITELVVALMLSFILSHLITRPFPKLMETIGQMKNNTYRHIYISPYTDEIGLLSQSINDMYKTIQNQIQQIKQDETDKLHFEMQLYAEQINPHFLYNTLECIDMEILNKHTETASFMLENLGQFLRIGLSYGEDAIPVEKELAHVQSYFNIINFRFNKAVKLNCEVSPDLTGHLLLKKILQPLVENCFKHGFKKDTEPDAVQSPVIEIEILHQDDTIVIEVADNGTGIDIEKAEEIMYSRTPDKHIGLQNVYRRLKIYYGSAGIRFQSIPFFRNSVIITIPFIE